MAAVEPRDRRLIRDSAIVELIRAAVGSHKRRVASIVLAQIVAMSAALAQPTLNAHIVDSGVVAGDVGYIERIGLLMLAVVAIGAVASIVAVACASRLAADVGADLRSRMYRRTTRMIAVEYRSLGTPTLLTRSTIDVNLVIQAVFVLAATAVTAPLVTVGAVVLSIRQSVRLSPVIGAVAVVLVVLVGVFVVALTPLSRQLQRAVDRVSLSLREQLSGVRVIRVFGREAAVGERFDEANAGLTALARRVGAVQALFGPVTLAVTNVGTVAATVWAADLIDRSQMTIGDLTAFTGYLGQVVSGLILFLPIATVWPRANAGAERIREVLGAADEPTGGGTAEFASAPLEVRFDAVTVDYPDATRPAVSSVTLTCAGGEVTAVIGGTSSGKSTLLATVARIVETSEGSVRVGGVRTDRVGLTALRAVVAHVGGEHQLVAGTIADNLRLADRDATDDVLWSALGAVRVASALRDRHGLDSVVTQGGRNFSGGQRQRLALARAIVRAPRVLVLDDAFSAMDRATAAAALDGVRRKLPDTTVIAAAQQIGSLADAHQIAVLDRGAVVDVGTHRDLVAESSVYRELTAAEVGT
ncbi:ABC transporter ATP-binding protein/permease [Gordonia sp. HY285]|uniref:ABC transporter ATP-binding protein n=1 Tax=Gordonia liuliyuniae TaxID=2911517 RepID=UPI001F1860C8|nr:ABC transporter ATP-binding protein [Gordonia liuliyuniae]MCF8608563.1 ABC transporter ATP-binding protein/permease [Gordonia liuliyuniae]